MAPWSRGGIGLSAPAVALLLSLSPAGPAAGQSARSWPELAGALTQRMALEEGERVLAVGRAGTFDGLVPALAAAVEAAGGTWLGAVSVAPGSFPGPPTEFVRATRGMSREELVAHFGDVDLGVMLPGATVGDPAYAAMQDVLREGRGRTIHFHWAGAYTLDGDLLPTDARIDATYRRALLETDYAALAAAQRAFEEAARRAEIRVTTPAGTDIRFRIGDRPVTRQDGDASRRRAAAARNLIDREIELPAGAVRVAPLEETVEGVIAFPPGTWGGERVEGLRLTFRQGRVVEIRAERGREAAESEMAGAGDAGRSFRELAVGFNPLLAIPDGDPWIPYYGYGGGVVRLSLGDNSELGGAVGGGYVRWNFFTDASVTVGGETWVSDGRLIRP